MFASCRSARIVEERAEPSDKPLGLVIVEGDIAAYLLDYACEPGVALVSAPGRDADEILPVPLHFWGGGGEECLDTFAGGLILESFYQREKFANQ